MPVFPSASDGHGMTNNLTAEQLRQALVAHLKEAGLLQDSSVESAFAATPRHLFIPHIDLENAYADHAIALKKDGHGRVLSSISQPSMIAIMLRQLQARPGHNVLEIGGGTGYNAALLRHIVGDEGHVTTIELDHELAKQAENNLYRAQISGVRVVQSDGALGYAPRAAYDRIIATVGVWDIPTIWVQQLKPFGRIVVPIWLDGVQVSATFKPHSDGTLYSDDNHPCAFIYMRGESAVPTIQKAVGNTSLLILSDDVEKIDTVALSMLLSDDHEISYLGYPLRPAEYWYGFQLYCMLNEPSGFIFAVYTVLGERKVYGLEGNGIALLGPGSAAFIPYDAQGYTHVYAGSDAFLALQTCADDWNIHERPGLRQLRLRLIPKSFGFPTISHGKIYIRRDNYLHVWLDEEAL